MNTQNSNQELEQWEREVDLCEVFQAIRTVPPPELSLARCLNRAAVLGERDSATVATLNREEARANRSGRHVARWRLPAAIAAMFLVAAFIFSNALPQKSLWAQVVSSVTQHPWIRLTLQRPAELAEDETFEPGVIWFTGDRSIAAIKAPGQVAWVDLTSGDQYELMDQALQIALTKLATRERQTINPLLEALTPFNVGFGLNAGNNQPNDKSEVSENGRDYLDYTFDNGSIDGQPGVEAIGAIVVRVDKETQQPIHVRWRTAIFDIDYPVTGPADIYALGVSRDTPLSDLRSMEKYFATRPNLTHDDYDATELMVLSGLEGKWINTASHYSSSGSQRSFAWANLTALLKLSTSTYFNDKQEPTGVVHPMDWWYAEVEKLPLEPSDWSEINFPHGRCYIPIGSVQQYHSTLPSRLKGLEGTVELRGKKSSVWLDPARDFIVRRLELVSNDGSISATQYDEVIQDSQGHWFPTQWREGRVSRRGQELPSEPHNINGVDVQTTVHFVRLKFK